MEQTLILTPQTIHYGQLVELASPTGNKEHPFNFSWGYHSGVKVHFFNKKGVFVGNYYEFVPYTRVRMRKDGIVYERHFMFKKDGSRRSVFAEFIRMSLYKIQCNIITFLIRKTQFI